ncbi:MAG: zinc ribbon domain-containing protein [Oscillospiraceae bacterium]|nr:zinc ribbon domain-containing protein [Oscillospiraceae bacterium]
MYESLLLNAGGGIISDSSKAPQAGNACLMIGVGGTGLAALRKVKKAVYQHLDPDDPNADIPRYERIAFLGIDTDTTDLEKTNPDVTDLQTSEQCSINLPSLSTLLRNKATLSDPCYKWLSGEEIKLQGDKGAGGVRQAGRFCLFKKANNIRAKLTGLINSVMGKANTNQVQVHIFAGISGGTGSGCFLDVCYMVRDVIESMGRESIICGYFFLADTQLHRPGIEGNKPVEDYNMRNGYAAFRDLDYCMGLLSSGDVFEAVYAPGFEVKTSKAPVDLCHLISGTDATGKVIPDGFSYGLNVVSEYVLNYLTDIDATADQKANDQTGLTMEGFIINVSTALSMIPPRVGAERNYHIVGASTAELPLTHIGTYLAAQTYEKMAPTLGRHATQQDLDQFCQDLNISGPGLVGRLAQGLNTRINFNPDMEMPQALNEDLDTCVTQSVADIISPVQFCENAAVSQIRANFDAQSTDLQSYDAGQIAQIQNPTFVAQVFNQLAMYCKDPTKGPTMAADLLKSDRIKDVQNTLAGLTEWATNQQQFFEGNLFLRKQDVANAAHAYNKAHMGRRRRLEAYEEAWQEYLKLRINIQLCRSLLSLLPILRNLLSQMSAGYFLPLSRMLEELRQTFKANQDWLNSPEHLKGQTFCWRIFQYDDVKEDLDANVLRPQDPNVEHQKFMTYLIDHFAEWSTGNEFRTGRCINDYMTEHFHETLNTAIDQFLANAYQVPANNLANEVEAKLLNAVNQRSQPLFWLSPLFTIDPGTTVSNNIMSIPSASTAISQATTQFSQHNTNVIVRKSRLGDRVSCLRFVSGIPLYAYKGIENLKGPYDSSRDKGLHLHERDENWRQTLPAPVPYSKNTIATESERAEFQKKSDLYDRAVAERVICVRSPEDQDAYVVRKVDNTEQLVSKYQRDVYFYGGQLQEAQLQQAMAALRAERAALLPDTVSDDKFLRLKNDGYSSDDPSLDATDIVRRDYFIRFNGLRKAAEDSLEQLERIDRKLEEMQTWMDIPKEWKKKVHRYLMLTYMGYLTAEGPVKMKLTFTFKGIRQEKYLCDVDTSVFKYRKIPDYQSFLSLEDESFVESRDLVLLDAELADKYQEPQAAWRAPTEALLEKLNSDFMWDINPKNSNSKWISDANCQAIFNFYQSLITLAKDDLEIMPVDKPEDKRVSERTTTTTTVSHNDVPPHRTHEQPASGWKCPSCGTQNAEEDEWCVECEAPRPKNNTPTEWTCPNCGRVLEWKRKFCNKCGPKFRRPEVKGPWKCPSCGTQNDADDDWCVECESPRP